MSIVCTTLLFKSNGILLRLQNMVFIFKVQTWNCVCGMRRSFAFTIDNILSVWYTATPGWTSKFGKVWKTSCQNAATRQIYGDVFLLQREVPGEPGARTSSYWVMPSNTVTKMSIFRDRVITELIYLLISAAMVSMMFRRLIWIHFFYHFLAIRLYHEFLSQLNCNFDIAFFEHYLLQTTTAAKQATEILCNFTYPHWNTS